MRARHVDFKEAWSKWPSIAKHILGAANVGQTVLVFGVKELSDKTLESIGLTAIVDKADILNGVKKYLDGQISEVRKTGLSRSLFGRVRPIPEINSPQPNMRDFSERTAMNTPMQGTLIRLSPTRE